MKLLHQARTADLASTDALSRLFEVTVVLSEAMADALGRRGLTTSRAEVLWRLHRDGPTTQRALSEALAVTPRNVTGLVDGLEGGGFVTREAHPTDRRATLVTLTKRGAKAAKTLADDQERMDQALFGDMPASQVRALVAALDRVLDRLPSIQRAVSSR